MDSTHSDALSSGPGDVTPTGNGAGSSTNPKMRKRTKTGCLTCRKRRIKCGEERPTCANCIKSKRQCEGYNQRVVFKPPIGDWPNHPGVVSTLQYHNSLLPGSRAPPYRSPPGTQSRDPNLSSLQPRPTEFDFSNINTGPVPGPDHLGQAFARQYSQDPYQQPLHSPHHQQSLHSPLHQQPLHSPHHQLPTPTSATSYFPTQSPVHTTFQAPYTHDSSTVYNQRYTPGAHYQHIPVSHDTQVDQKPVVSTASNPSESQQYQEQAAYHQPRSAGISEQQNPYLLPSDAPSRVEEYPQYNEQRPSLTRYGSNPQLPVSQSQHAAVGLGHGSYAAAPTISHADSTHSNFQTVQIPSHNVHSDVTYPQHAVLVSLLLLVMRQFCGHPPKPIEAWQLWRLRLFRCR
ncbi:hypothetical protein BDV96DRAFT_120957 [Lophiotrema nucula]|uniref:Zn(2)-C6 fungal-type domain-containing protein n=1 Tax=Lophiotrema nucula TaxID=690887 RepID=A0A6A5Z2L9_9PLEO|nr:hypothetical protein BDV96DRAFT_120957 [Lophiotrema nucula]